MNGTGKRGRGVSLVQLLVMNVVDTTEQGAANEECVLSSVVMKRREEDQMSIAM